MQLEVLVSKSIDVHAKEVVPGHGGGAAHAPSMQIVVPVQVVTGESDTRSGPHATTVVTVPHTFWPGVAFVQAGSIGTHEPWFGPVAVSQSCPLAHVWL